MNVLRKLLIGHRKMSFSYGGNMGETFKITDTIETEWLNEVETKLQQATEIINEVRSLVSEKTAGKI